MSRLRHQSDDGGSDQALPGPLEATVVREDGGTVPVVILGRRSASENGPVLHWELHAPHPASAGVLPMDSPLSSATFDDVRRIAQAVSDIAAEETPEATVARLVEEAQVAVPHADEAGVLLARSRGPVETAAATGEVARACDELQVRLSDAPFRAVLADTQLVAISSVADDARWPEFARGATELGVGAILTVPLRTPRGVAGTVNFYARERDAFDVAAHPAPFFGLGCTAYLHRTTICAVLPGPLGPTCRSGGLGRLVVRAAASWVASE